MPTTKTEPQTELRADRFARAAVSIALRCAAQENQAEALRELMAWCFYKGAVAERRAIARARKGGAE